MKNLFTRLMLVAVAAMGFVACQDGFEDVTIAPEASEVVMTITADADDTRTVLDEYNYKVQWHADDKLRVLQTHTTTDGSITTITDTSETTIDSNDKASFTVSFEETTADAFSYNAIYPHSSVVSGSTATKVKIRVKDAQTSTATSFDPEADILVSNTIESTVQPTSLNMRFARLVALGKMTLTNLPTSSTISKVAFSVEGTDENNATKIAGRNYVDATTGVVSEYGYYGETNTITINYDEPISTRDIYFTCNPFVLVEDEKFTVKVTCNDCVYTREVTIPAGRSLIFKQGDLNTFSVDMTNASTESNVAFPDGEYAVIAIAGGKYYALSSEANGSRLNAVQVTYTPGESLKTTNETLKWTIAHTDNGYTFKGSNNQYIAWSSGNYAKTQDDVYYLDITEDGDTGRYNVTSKTDATRKLQRNSAEANSYFAFYTSEQSGSLYLVPIDTTPCFEVTPNEQSISADGGSVEFTVNPINNFTATITATTEAEWLEISNAGYTYTATASANTGATREATITFSADGYESVSVTVSQEGKSAGGETISATLSFADAANRVECDTDHQVWKQNGITFTNNKNGTTTNVADYYNPVRLYKGSEVVIVPPGYGSQTQIVFDCSSSSYAEVLEKSITVGTVSRSGDKVTVTYGGLTNTGTYTIDELSGQVRLDSLTIYTIYNL